jgi:hypothetical protein
MKEVLSWEGSFLVDANFEVIDIQEIYLFDKPTNYQLNFILSSILRIQSNDTVAPIRRVYTALYNIYHEWSDSVEATGLK